MPSSTFWLFNKNIDRLSAERDLRTASIAVQSQSGDAIREMFDELRKQMGSVVEFDKEAMVKQAMVKDDNNRSDLKDLNYIGEL